MQFPVEGHTSNLPTLQCDEIFFNIYPHAELWAIWIEVKEMGMNIALNLVVWKCRIAYGSSLTLIISFVKQKSH